MRKGTALEKVEARGSVKTIRLWYSFTMSNRELIEARQNHDQWRVRFDSLSPVTIYLTMNWYRWNIKGKLGSLSTPEDYQNFLYLIRAYFRIDPLMRLFYVIITIAYIIGCVQIFGRTWPRCTSTTGSITEIQYAFKDNGTFVYSGFTFPQCQLTFDENVASQYGIVGYSHVYNLGDSVDLTLCGHLDSPDPQDCFFDDMKKPTYNSDRIAAFVCYGMFATFLAGFLGFVPLFTILWHDLIFGYAYIQAKAKSRASLRSDEV